jgi:hypothetical protein
VADKIAAVECALTGQRPTCIEWQPDDLVAGSSNE